ncbi:MAG: hypothetical protein ACLQVF_45050 [Isosphaeraceae bacterium]
MNRPAWKWLGFRSAWDWLWCLRSSTLVVAFVVFFLGFLVVTVKVPWMGWLAVLLMVAVEVRNVRRRRGSSAHDTFWPVTIQKSQDAAEAGMPAWLDHARSYYSEIGGEESGDPVSVFDVSDTAEDSSDSPGTLCLRLEPQFPSLMRMRVLDAGGREQGVIRSEGLVPGVRYAMRRDGKLVWKLSVRSILRNRHTLELANGDSWRFDTPFFWWQNLTGTASGAPRLLGGLVVPTTMIWGMWIEPGRESRDLLAAVAYMHRQYCHW